ncbi:hypothetical protein U1Q18_049797 [Sarracenia purpurea var. burkii]
MAPGAEPQSADNDDKSCKIASNTAADDDDDDDDTFVIGVVLIFTLRRCGG